MALTASCIQPQRASAETNTETLSTPQIGGPFALLDHTGRALSERDFRGSFMLVFFGYTHCPDICPTELQLISEAIDGLGESGAKVQPIFITVDPERDTPEVLADWLSNFHPRMIGLTGSRAQVAAARKAYRVYAAKFYPPPGSLSGEGDDDEGSEYLLDHSAITYLVGPDGRMRAVFPQGSDGDEMAATIRAHLSRPQ